jgi:hypothetical protein
MKKIILSNKENPHFIGSWNILNNQLCKDIIFFLKIIQIYIIRAQLLAILLMKKLKKRLI